MRLFVLALLLVLGPSSASAQGEDGACERVVLVPLEPSGLSPEAARVEEDKLRELVAKSLGGLCVPPRKEAAEVLAKMEGRRLPVCEEVSCRKALAERFGADWLISGTAFGFGGGRTVTLNLWSKDGLRIQRSSYASGVGVDEQSPAKTIIALFHEARTGRSIAEGNGQEGPVKVKRSRWPELALGAAAVTALAGGVAFGAASQDIERKISTQKTGCPGTGEEYARCFEDTVGAGKQQALTANILFGASALLGGSAAVIFVVDLP